MPQIPRVSKEEAIGFAKIWTYKGIAIPIDETHCQFAADFASVTLATFIDMCQKQAASANKPKENKVELG